MVLTMRASGGTSIGVVSKLMDMYATLGRGVMAGNVI